MHNVINEKLSVLVNHRADLAVGVGGTMAEREIRVERALTLHKNAFGRAEACSVSRMPAERFTSLFLTHNACVLCIGRGP